VFLVITAAILLVWSHFKLLWHDEVLVLWANRVPGLQQLIRIQRFYPVSLDPLLYHAVSHAAILTFGANAFAIRFPSMFGFLLMQVCLLVFVRRIAGEGAGIVALAFPSLTPALWYAIEGKPYGMMLGLIGVVMVSWQTAARRDSKRTAALVALGLGIAFVLNSHFFGVLVIAPLCAAEGWRTLQRRKFDFPILAAIATGMLGVLFILPFLKGPSEFKAHVWDPFVDPRQIPRFYHLILPGFYHPILPALPQLSIHALFLIQDLFAVILFALIVSYFWFKDRQTPNLRADEIFLLALTALPIFAFLLARISTHSFEPRYSIGALAGISGLAGMGLQPIFARLRTPVMVFAVFLPMMVAVNTMHIAEERSVTKGIISKLTCPPRPKPRCKHAQVNRCTFRTSICSQLQSTMSQTLIYVLVWPLCTREIWNSVSGDTTPKPCLRFT
jgi:hypothetical protein